MLKAVEENAKRLKTKMSREDARAYDDRRWSPSRTGRAKKLWKAGRKNEYDSPSFGVNSPSYVPIALARDILHDLGYEQIFTEASHDVLRYTFP